MVPESKPTPLLRKY